MNSILISYFKKPSQCHVTMSNKHIHVFQSIPINAEKTLLYALQLQISFSSTM